jgi:predicted RNA-binding Zn ribbon-like protein
VARARALREAIYRIFRAAVQHWEAAPDDLEVLNRELSRARAHEALVADGRRVGYAWKSDGELDRLLWPVARSAAELLTGELLARVSQCGGDDCHWLFLDTSKNRSRRWCDMADCGNRAKVRRFRRG